MIKKKDPRDAKRPVKEIPAQEEDKPLSRKEIIRQIRSGNLTEEQTLELRRRYMDSLEYNGTDPADPDGNR